MTDDVRRLVTLTTLVELSALGIPWHDLPDGRVMVAGVLCEMASTSDIARGADLLVCKLAPGYYADDVHTVCADCHRAIVHRPHVPAGGVTVCPDCLDRRLA